VFVHHVADAHGGDDLHEVGRQAPVEAQGSLRVHDVPEQAAHGHLGASRLGRCRGMGEEGETMATWAQVSLSACDRFGSTVSYIEWHLGFCSVVHIAIQSTNLHP